MTSQDLPAHASGERSVGAGSIGVAITGDNARMVTLPAEAVRWAQEVAAPPGAANLPGSASGVFVGRGGELARLRELLSSSGETVVTQSGAVHGLGGVGKSTLALHYAHQYRARYGLVWWVTAESAEQINSGLGALAMWLCPQWAAGADTDERTAWAVVWLQWHPGWLLVFDNVEDPNDLRPFIGMLPGGHHLATSRKATGWHAVAPAMPLGVLGPEAAADLLCKLALDGRRPTAEQRADAADLARDLGCLPLALEQAGAYLSQTGTGIAAYREALALMLSRAADGTDPERTIARIWDQTLTAISARSALAVTLLNTLAWLAPDGLPRSLLTRLVPDSLALDEALGVLHAYNMVTFTGPELSIHRLLQTVLRARTPVGGTGTGTSTGTGAEANAGTGAEAVPPGRAEAEQILLHALQPGGEDLPDSSDRWSELIPHALALALSTPGGRHSARALNCYQITASHLYRQGQRARAIPLYEATLAHRERVLGPTHLNTLVALNNVATGYEAAGDLTRAIALFETNLAQRELTQGHDHASTQVARNNLAHACKAAGDLKRATRLYETNLAQRELALGDEHPDTLMSRNNLATAYDDSGDLTRAIPLYETTLAQRERVLGNTHPDTLSSRNNLAYAYRAAGDLDRAVPLYETTLAQRELVLGQYHPDTLASRNNLGYAYKATGDLARAIPLYETTLAQRERILGDTHPDTLVSRNNLATAYDDSGDLDRAIPLYETTLAQRQRILGDTHPDTLNSRNNLGYAYQAAGDLDRAIPLYEATLAQREAVLGDTHPDTLTSRNNLAHAYKTAGDLDRAIPLYETTLAQRLRIHGEDHPNTRISRRNLAAAHRAVEAAARAAAVPPQADGPPAGG